MSTRKKSSAVAHGVGRPVGKGNPSAVEKIRRDRDNIVDAVRKRALTGDGPAAELALKLIGAHPDCVEVLGLAPTSISPDYTVINNLNAEHTT